MAKAQQNTVQNTECDEHPDSAQMQRIAELEQACALEKKKCSLLEDRLLLLENYIKHLKRGVFGSTSEKIDPRQLELMLQLQDSVAPKLESPAKSDTSTPKKRPAPKPIEDRVPAGTPIKVEFIDPQEVTDNPEQYKHVSDEVHDELIIIPAQFYIRRIIRRKYTKIDDRSVAPIIAPASKRLIENSYASVSLLVHLVLNKYVDHIPLYRLERIFKTRYGVEISRKTLSDWVWHIGNWFRVIYGEMKKELSSYNYMQIDETFIKYLSPGHGTTKQGYLWAYHVPSVGIVFEWHCSRAATCLDEMLSEYKGIIHCDGYKAYRTYVDTHSEIEISACWAHTRRKFEKAKDETHFSVWMMKQIQLLYLVEAKLRKQNAGPALREAIRQSESLMIINRIKKALHLKLGKCRGPETVKAMNYTLKLWDELKKYIFNGKIEIDTNLTENAIRPTAIGKKNWMFFGGKDAGWQSAVIYSILESCSKLGINQEEYLTDALSKLPELTSEQAIQLTPSKWLQAKKTKSSVA